MPGFSKFESVALEKLLENEKNDQTIVGSN